MRLAFTGLFGFSTIPLRVATTIGFLCVFRFWLGNFHDGIIFL